MRVGIIGYGRMGSEFARSIRERGFEIGTIVRTSGVYTLDGEKVSELDDWLVHFRKIDIAALCIPTVDDGRTAFEYIAALVKKGIPVVTCEKGALGNYFSELKDWLDKIGFRASVGGKTGMASWLRENMTPTVREIHAVLNATMNFTFDGVGGGRILEQVIEEAKTLGYTEPKTVTPLEVINKETTGDIPMKTAILFNTGIGGRFGPFIKAKDIFPKLISEEDLRRLVREAASRRFVVSITKEDQEENVIGGFKQRFGNWIISAGFKLKEENPVFRWLNPKGVDNALVLYEGKYGKIGLIGEGAGSSPTVSSMIRDTANLLRFSG